MGTSFRDFAAVFFHLSDGVRFSTCVRLLPVRVFPFFLFLYVVFLILLGIFRGSSCTMLVFFLVRTFLALRI